MQFRAPAAKSYGKVGGHSTSFPFPPPPLPIDSDEFRPLCVTSVTRRIGIAADDDDDDCGDCGDDDDDDDDFEEEFQRSFKSKSFKSCKSFKSSKSFTRIDTITKRGRETIPDKSGQALSTWIDKHGNDAFKLAKIDFVREVQGKHAGQFGTTYLSGNPGGKNGLSVCCINGKRFAGRDAQKCSLGLYCVWKTPGDKKEVSIKYWNSDHSPDCLVFGDDGRVRKHNAYLKDIIGGSATSIGDVLRMPGVSALHAGHAAVLQNCPESCR